MQKPIDYIKDAENRGVAIGHFNISDMAALNAICESAKELGLPIFIGVSEGEREFIGIKKVRALVSAATEEYGIPVFLNADHTYSFEKIKEVVAAGYDSIIFDGAKLSFEENVRQTKQVVEYARSVNPAILVEAELGYIGTSSKLLDKIPEGAGLHLTTPEEAAEFVKATGIDLLAPAVGNIHGMLKNAPEPRLDIPRIAAVREACGVPLVLHGGSGTKDEDFVAGIKAGISMIHINTEIRVAWKNGIAEFMKANPDETTPYKILKSASDSVKKVVLARLKLFNS
ncbi:MAG: tagatose-bisphosphate aldolase [Candidatus Colwellbacteria bacterium RIFCSPLOWO2_01_FULL_48_10]|uniref:Tagatose-bisphosphate aldolase n=2 Tax=Bacteria candidate phyla TaxID=1783234 RepID=A0A1F5P2T7_9BACT|nr:MAG: tagatose-bisphosphate aldolase [Candidatus Doudnabacteria bacterium RIFCSPHIGHO2_01_FULL_49_9]OGY59179.1 MAG: tagatose-bisphosphate aldolase [Candidatus Colwellbacteria bacterium RIFCSPLOWO2_01_FULL_48_10]